MGVDERPYRAGMDGEKLTAGRLHDKGEPDGLDKGCRSHESQAQAETGTIRPVSVVKQADDQGDGKQYGANRHKWYSDLDIGHNVRVQYEETDKDHDHQQQVSDYYEKHIPQLKGDPEGEPLP